MYDTSSPAKARACAAASGFSRSIAVPLLTEMLQALNALSVTGTNTNIRIVDPIMCIHLVLQSLSIRGSARV